MTTPRTDTTYPGPDVTYHGYQRETGGSVVAIEDADGATIGLVRHVVKHSPTGIGWGYAGSGAADCARSLLIAALGEDAARCPDCAGAQRIGWDRRAAREGPYDPARAGDFDPETIGSCWCDGGYRSLPYQRFKFEYVTSWDGEWRLSSRDILAWLRQHGVNGLAGG